jgi:hypothetical protein
MRSTDNHNKKSALLILLGKVAVYSIEDSSGPQNLWVSIVLKASKSVGAKGDVPKIYGFVHPLHPCQRIPCLVNIKSTVDILSIYVAFLENVNFKMNHSYLFSTSNYHEKYKKGLVISI